MVNFSNLNNLFEKYNRKVGELSGELFDIYRPDYTNQDNTPILVYSQLRYRMGISKAENFAEPMLSNVNVYDIFGNRGILQPGDLLIKGPLASPDVTYPAVTIAHKHSLRALIGMRSSLRCHIVNSYSAEDETYDYVYENVYYDYAGPAAPHGSLTSNYAGSGQPVPYVRAILFAREGINQEGMQLIETDYLGVPNGNKWYITEILNFGPYMLLTLDANWRR